MAAVITIIDMAITQAITQPLFECFSLSRKYGILVEIAKGEGGQDAVKQPDNMTVQQRSWERKK